MTEQALQASRLDAFSSVLSAFGGGAEAGTTGPLTQPASDGPLDGLAIGVKEVIDVAGAVCNRGCAAFDGRVPGRSANIVQRLEKLGARVAAITRSTELAIARPTTTRNPHDPKRSPGGSSSGSAAAVGAGLLPFALGSQTIGSTIRPAAYCGVAGFKPGHGILPLDGVLSLSPTLDHLGFFADTAARLAQVVAGLDVRLQAKPACSSLRIGFVRPWFETAVQACVHEGLERARTALLDAGHRCEDVAVPVDIAAAEAGVTTTILEREMATTWFDNLSGDTRISDVLRAMLERGAQIEQDAYIAALDTRRMILHRLDEEFDSLDLLVAPAVTGPPPWLSEGTGSRDPQRLWTLAGLPTVSLPVGSHEGLPLAVQLVGRRGRDGDLLGLMVALEGLIRARHVSSPVV